MHVNVLLCCVRVLVVAVCPSQELGIPAPRAEVPKALQLHLIHGTQLNTVFIQLFPIVQTSHRLHVRKVHDLTEGKVLEAVTVAVNTSMGTSCINT